MYLLYALCSMRIYLFILHDYFHFVPPMRGEVAGILMVSAFLSPASCNQEVYSEMVKVFPVVHVEVLPQKEVMTFFLASLGGQILWRVFHSSSPYPSLALTLPFSIPFL